VIELGGRAAGTVSRSWQAPPEGGWLELGIVIFDPQWWGRGHGSEALREWTGLCFRETDAHVITLTTWSGNERMMRAALRVGYREAARIREARSWQDRRWDSVKFDLLRREWAP
jgi:RimJ/RimL family protein N-acetyltransferase